MVQVIPAGNQWSMLGQGLGQGLSEQIPKEVEHYRLSQGLRELAQEKNLSPRDFATKAYGIKGITPQMVESLGELAKHENIKKAYGKGRRGTEDFQIPRNDQNNLQNIKFGNFQPGQETKRFQPNQQQTIPTYGSPEQQAFSEQGAANENPLQEKFIPVGKFNQQQYEDAISEAFESGKATTFPEAQAYAKEAESRYMAEPESARAALDYRKEVDNEVDKEFNDQLQARIQKQGTDTYKDLTGDLQENLKKQARNSVATGRMTPKQAAEFYSKKALDLAKDKQAVNKIANRDVIDRIIPHKKEQTIKSLQNISKTFADLGSSEEYYDLLQQENDVGGLGLSPGGAAIIAYPRSDNVKSLVSKTKPFVQNFNYAQDPKIASNKSREFAENLSKIISPNDSFLAIAREMKQKDASFDEAAYFDYLRENQDSIGLTPRLKKEITTGVSDFFPNWMDIGLFPAFNKSVAND